MKGLPLSVPFKRLPVRVTSRRLTIGVATRLAVRVAVWIAITVIGFGGAGRSCRLSHGRNRKHGTAETVSTEESAVVTDGFECWDVHIHGFGSPL